MPASPLSVCNLSYSAQPVDSPMTTRNWAQSMVPSKPSRAPLVASETAMAPGSNHSQTQSLDDKQRALESAAHLIETHLQSDNSLPTLAEKLRVNLPTGVASVSGLHECDYPSLSASLAATPSQLLFNVRHLPLPQQLVQRLAHVQRSCAMGLLDDAATSSSASGSSSVLLGRAWLVADSDIYIWRLEGGGGDDVIHYDALTDALLAVAAVPVRSGVFHSHITHLLCATLPLEVVLLGVSVTSVGGSVASSIDPHQLPRQLQLLPEPIFTAASDGVQFSCLAATVHGRIFMGGSDGCLYELEYGSSSSSAVSSVGLLGSWLGGLAGVGSGASGGLAGSGGYCRKINHTRSMLSLLVPTFVSTALFSDDPLIQICVDNTRQLLYTRSNSSHVRVYHLGADGSQLYHLAELSLSAIVSAAAIAAPTVDSANFKPLVDIAPVVADVCACVHLVATTVHGVRLYFSTATADWVARHMATAATGPAVAAVASPSCLRLVHVRLPPGFAANTSQHQRPSQLHSARHLAAGSGDDTVALMIAAQTADSDALWLMSGQQLAVCQQQHQQQIFGSPAVLGSDLQRRQSEQYCTLPMRMRVWDVCEMSGGTGVGDFGGGDDAAVVGANLLAALGTPKPPLGVIQHMLPRRCLAAVSVQGVQLLELMRPVDRLRTLLEQWQQNAGSGSSGAHTILSHQLPATNWSRVELPGDNSQLVASAAPQRLHALLSGCGAADAVHVLADCVLLACCDGGDGVSGVATRAARILMQYGGQTGHPVQLGQSVIAPGVLGVPGVSSPAVASAPVAGDRSMLQLTFRPQQMSTPRQEITATVPGTDAAIPMSPLVSPTHIQHQQQQPVSVPGGANVAHSSGYSLRHDALYLYTSRLLRPLWSTTIVRPLNPNLKATSGVETEKLTSSFSSDELAWICGRLSALEQFLRRHMTLTSAPGTIVASSRNMPGGAVYGGAAGLEDMYTSPGPASASVHQLQRRLDSLLPDQPMSPGSPSSPAGGIQDMAMSPAGAGSAVPGGPGASTSSEASSLASLLAFVGYAKEIIGLMKIIADHQTHVITDALDTECRSALCRTLYGYLLTCPEASRRCCTLLIDTLVGRYLDDAASTAAITARLRRVCPALFRPEQAASARAAELLMTARQLTEGGGSSGGRRREQLLDEALELVRPVVGKLQLATICQHFESVQHYDGVVELVLAAAEQRDPRCVAGHFYTSGEPVDDAPGRQAYNDRSECYSCLLDLLSSLQSRATATSNVTMSTTVASASTSACLPSLSTSQFNNIISSIGVGGGTVLSRDDPTNSTAVRVSADGQQLRRQLQLVIDRALSSGDQLLHVHVFGWMLANSLTDQLLQVRSDYLEEYLRRTAAADPRPSTLELLWRHYERREKHVAAARVLAKMAERHGTDFDLSRRIECLARAILCVKSGDNRALMTANVTHGELLHELEEKLEVGRIQSRVLSALSSIPVTSPALSSSITRLNADLLDVTALYQLCEEYDLWRLKLAIVACAGHRDPSLVATLWTGLLRHELLATVATSTGISSDQLIQLSPLTASAAASAVIEFVSEYIQQPAYLSLKTIVTVLETMSAEWRERCPAVPAEVVGWVVRSLSEAGISLQQLLSVYLTVYHQSDLVWSRFHCPLHLLEVIINILAMFAASPALIPANQRMAFRSECLDAVSVCVNELNASGDKAASQLLSRLMGVQASLQRIVSV